MCLIILNISKFYVNNDLFKDYIAVMKSELQRNFHKIDKKTELARIRRTQSK
jgi:hypothetical protein